jgi:hypothetical protein
MVYLDLLRQAVRAYGVSVWGYGLTSNHVHGVAVPRRSAALAEAGSARVAAAWLRLRLFICPEVNSKSRIRNRSCVGVYEVYNRCHVAPARDRETADRVLPRYGYRVPPGSG